MRNNYFTIILRLLGKHKFYVSLNFLGLVLGITFSILLILLIRFDFSYDNYFDNHENIFRIGMSEKETSGEVINNAVAPTYFASQLSFYYPEIKHSASFTSTNKPLVQYGDKKFFEENILTTDTAAFNIFSYEFINGNSESCFNNPNSIVITESFSKKYFGNNNSLHKVLIVNNDYQFTVTAVIKDLPPNVHLQFDALVSRALKGTPYGYVYVKLDEKADVGSFTKKINTYFADYTNKILASQGKALYPIIQSLEDTHFRSGLIGDRRTSSRIYGYTFIVMLIIILLITCLNYVNLAGTQNITRHKEVSIRKISGASTFELAKRFLGEATTISLSALVVSLIFIKLILSSPEFIQLINRPLEFNLISDFSLVIFFIFYALVIGLLSGSYPAFYLSKLSPADALKGTYSPDAFGTRLRKYLVAIQFAASIGIVICTILINSQIDFILTKDLGFQKENVLLLKNPDVEITEDLPVIIEELKKHSDVLEVSTAMTFPGRDATPQEYKFESNSGIETKTIKTMWVLENYPDVMKLNFVNGKGFDKIFLSKNEQSIIINETLANELNIKNSSGGIIKSTEFDGSVVEWNVVGIVKDFNIVSLHNNVEPIVMRAMSHPPMGRIHLRITGNRIDEIITYTKKVWNKYIPAYPFDYYFLDENLNQYYKEDKTQADLMNLFSVASILLSVMGLVGITSFKAKEKTSEIAIRKVLGASVTKILIMFSHQIAAVIFTAFVISAPVSYWIINLWKGSFAYQVNTNLVSFLLVLFWTLFLAVGITIIYSFKVANTNPVEAIREE